MTNDAFPASPGWPRPGDWYTDRMARTVYYRSKENWAPNRTLTNSVYDGAWVTADVGNLRFRVKLHDFVSMEIATNGEWEPSLTKAILGRLTKGGVFLDIGANLGWFTLNAAARYRELGGGQVLGFEPHPVIYPQLVRAIGESALTEYATVHPFALGDARGTVGMASDNANLAGSFIERDKKLGGIASVLMVRFDEVFQINPKVDCIKLDIEGAEPIFVRGAQQFFSRQRPPVYSEIHHSKIKAVSKCTPEEYIAAMEGLGYDALHFDGAGNLSELTEGKLHASVTVEVFFQPKVAHHRSPVGFDIGRPYDADVLAWDAAVIAAGGLVSPTRRDAVDQLVYSLKQAGVWRHLDRLWLFAAENTPSALIDLVARSRATPVNDPAFETDRGYTGNGTSQSINTNFNASTAGGNFTLNDAGMGVWIVTPPRVTGGFEIANNYSAYSFFGVNGMNASTMRWAVNSAKNIEPLVTNSYIATGWFHTLRMASNVDMLLRNGSSLAISSQAAGALMNREHHVLSYGAVSSFSDAQVGAAFIGGSLASTAPEFYTAMRTYMTTVGVP